MIEIIQNNPFRVLGVYTSATLRERSANATKIGRYQDVGKSVSFPSDIESVFGPICRTKESIAKATAQINLANDKIKYSFFWLSKATGIDEIALNHLEAGDIDKCKYILSKNSDFSALINLSVLAFVESDYMTAIDYALSVIKDSDIRNEFVTHICDDTVQFSEDELQQLYLNAIVEVLPDEVVKNLRWEQSKFKDVASLFKQKAAQEPIDEINALVSQAKQISGKDATQNYEMGKRLMICAYTNLPKIKEVLGSANSQYQMTCDTIADQILQCGINYHNNTSDHTRTKIQKAFELQNFAATIAVGSQARDRCKDNVNILKKKIANLPPAEIETEAEKIEDLLDVFNQAPTSVKCAQKLLDDALPIIVSCIRKVGSKNKAYLALSTQVVQSALSDVIDVVNRAQEEADREGKKAAERSKTRDPFDILSSLSGYGGGLGDYSAQIAKRNAYERCLKGPLREAWSATLSADCFQLEPEYKKNYLKNRKTLADLCRTFSVGGDVYYEEKTYSWQNFLYKWDCFAKWVSEKINKKTK